MSDHDLPAVDGGHLQRDRFAGSRSTVAEETDACSFPACHPHGSSVERKHEAHRTRPGTQRNGSLRPSSRTSTCDVFPSPSQRTAFAYDSSVHARTHGRVPDELSNRPGCVVSLWWRSLGLVGGVDLGRVKRRVKGRERWRGRALR